jgi:hypothetical protein
MSPLACTITEKPFAPGSPAAWHRVDGSMASHEKQQKPCRRTVRAVSPMAASTTSWWPCPVLVGQPSQKCVGLIRILRHPERGGYDGSDGKWIEGEEAAT